MEHVIEIIRKEIENKEQREYISHIAQSNYTMERILEFNQTHR